MSNASYKCLGDFLRDKIKESGKPKSLVAEETGNRPETISRLIAKGNKAINHASLGPFCKSLNLNDADKLEFYRLAGVVTPEINTAFVKDEVKAEKLQEIATSDGKSP